MSPIKKIVVANRGEIAIRVMRTCREMGIPSVALLAEADAGALHARFADETIRIKSYLDIQEVVAAAKRSHADAIHPGYGFLSENASFAESSEKAGLTFIGPRAKSIRLMGDKIQAKALMKKAGVPVIPEEGFPLLVKAAAGGGGKGMRIVRSEKELKGAKESASREALRAFGDGALLLEKYLEPVRHIEVQIFGDVHGNLVHLFERECSLQRRHQKILEESPSLAIDDDLRQRLYAAALKAARAVDYVNAGTVEFVVTPQGDFYFLEMNTRLQVEHPVTEMVTGLDLVRLQIEVGEGKPLSVTQKDIARRGHAVEVRLYAENPAKKFLPAPGTIGEWRWENMPGTRLEAGVEKGSRVGIHYDPLLAKVVAWGADRGEALRKLSWMLDRSTILGVITNRDFLRSLIRHPDVVAGKLSTTFVETRLSEITFGPTDAQKNIAEEIAEAYLFQKGRTRNLLPNIPLGFRNNPFPLKKEALQIVEWKEGAVRVDIDGVERDFKVFEQPDFVHVQFGGEIVAVPHPRGFPKTEKEDLEDGVHAPMSGRVMRVLAVKGQSFERGEPLVIIEAMKMEQTIASSRPGKVREVRVQEGDLVQAGHSLLDISS